MLIINNLAFLDVDSVLVSRLIMGKLRLLSAKVLFYLERIEN